MSGVAAGPLGAEEVPPDRPPKGALPAVAQQAQDFANIRTAVADAAGVSNGLWLSYLFVLFYLLVAAGGVTHQDLFLESRVKLPFLGVELPLKGFFVLGPLLFLIVHAYVLLHFVLLADKARMLNEQLIMQDASPDTKVKLQRQFPINIFIQLLAGPPVLRKSPLGLLMLLIAWISLMLGPVALLIFFQLQFLPYHSEWVTWWHRLAIVIDLGLLWSLWPMVARVTLIERDEPRSRWARTGVMGSVSLASLLLIFGIATFPGEWLEEALPSFPLREAIVAGDIEESTSRPSSLWSNRLVLPGLDVVDHAKFDSAAKIAAAPVIASLRRRNLERAVLIDATLPRVDFTAANLKGATFIRARLQGSWFDHAVLHGVRLDDARLQGASFYQAQLQGASLAMAALQGGRLAGAQLRGAWLAHAKLAGASLAGADLRRASFENADLRGANLSQARLQGVSFAGAKLHGASLRHAYVWRTDFRQATPVAPPGLRIENADADVQTPPCEGPPRDACDPAETLDGLREVVTRYMPAGWARDRMLARLGPILDPAVQMQDEDEIKAVWDKLASEWTRPSGTITEGDERSLAQLWGEIACAVNGAPYVATMLLEAMDDANAFTMPRNGQTMPELAAGLLADQCAARFAMGELTRMQLLELTLALRGGRTPSPKPAAPMAQHVREDASSGRR